MDGFLPDKIMPIFNSEPVSTKVRFLMPDSDWLQLHDQLLASFLDNAMGTKL